MKKITTMLLAVCLLLSLGSTLTSCMHKCTFTNYQSNENSHWLVCDGEDCEETSGLADHVWDTENAVIVAPTQEADGTKTFTCTACGKEKVETIAFTGLSEEDWNAVFAESAFENFTYTEDATVETTGLTVTSKVIYRVTADAFCVSMEMMGQTQEETYTGSDRTTMMEAFFDSLDALFAYEDYEYDAETKSYRFVGEASITSSGTVVDVESATIVLKDGKIFSYEYEGTATASGITMTASSSVTFSDYGTTVIEE